MPSNNNSNDHDYIMTFVSSNYALKAEQYFIQSASSITIKLISAPRSISSQCGFCLLITISNKQDLNEIINGFDIEYQSIFTREIINGVKHYEKQD